MTLARYLALRYLRVFLLIGGVFLAILFLIDMVEQIRRYADDGIGLAGAARLSALSIGGGFYAILPLIAALAGIALFMALARSSEMVAIRASGRSAMRGALAPAVMAALIGLFAVAALNPMVAATQKRLSSARESIEQGGNQTISLGDSAVWLRQGIGDEQADSTDPGTTDSGALRFAAGGQMVIQARRTSPDAATLFDATFLLFDAESNPTSRIEARRADLKDGAWELSEAKEWPLIAPNPEGVANVLAKMRLPTDLTTDRIREGFGRPDSVPIWQLPRYIAGLQRAGFSAARHQVWFQMELALPLTMAAMVAIAAVFTMGHLRGRRSGALALAGFAGAIGLFFLRNLAQVLGDNGAVTPPMAAWIPPLVALLLAVGALLQLEDG